MLIAQPVRTTMDRNGNSRRGWIIYKPSAGSAYPTLLGFVVRELHMTDGTFRDMLPGVVFLGELKISAGEYRDAKRHEETPEHIRAASEAMEGN